MVHQKLIGIALLGGGLLAGLTVTGFVGCSSAGATKSTDAAIGAGPMAGADSAGSAANPSPAAAAVMAPAKPIGQPGKGQELFATDMEAARALAAAAKSNDREAMRRIFGPAGKELASGDSVEDRNDRADFAQRAAEQLRMVQKNDKTSWVYVGKEEWPFPIPLTRMDNGKWLFDTEAGKEEILSRRIGDNELQTIGVCRTYVLAQREYATEARDDSGVLQYAQHLMSTPGHHDGLYWETKSGEQESPLGPLVADARMDGYGENTTAGRHPFHGYYFHILNRQGAKAAGGAYDYVINAHMIAGFALVASPDKYGSSGIMTFIINQQGKLYQKDLGAHTDQVARNMKEYSLDESWALVTD